MGTFVEPLDPNTPADSDLASSGDDSIRQLKRSIIERLETFFVDADANPLVPINPAVSILRGTLTIPKENLDFGIGKRRAFDVTVTGAKAGDVAGAEFESVNNTTFGAPEIYPGSPGVAANNAESLGDERDSMLVKAWCIDDDLVRVHIMNLTDGTVGRPTYDRTIRAWVIQAGETPAP